MEEYMTHHEKARFQELAARGEILGKTAQASANEEIIRWTPVLGPPSAKVELSLAYDTSREDTKTFK